MKNTLIISGFPGIGKTYFYRAYNNDEFIIADSDSSKYSHKVVNGERIKNPTFVEEYIEHIKSLIGKIDIILVSTHEDVRNALMDNNIPFTIIYPDESLLNEYIGRYFMRGSDIGFLNLLASNFYNWISDIDSIDNKKVDKIKMSEYGTYLCDIFRTYYQI